MSDTVAYVPYKKYGILKLSYLAGRGKEEVCWLCEENSQKPSTKSKVYVFTSVLP
jgi:hypothetical protein